MSSLNPSIGKFLPTRSSSSVKSAQDEEEDFPPPRLSTPVAGRSTNDEDFPTDELFADFVDLSGNTEDTFHRVTEPKDQAAAQASVISSLGAFSLVAPKYNLMTASALPVPTGKQAKNSFALGEQMDGAAASMDDIHDPTRLIQALATHVDSSLKVTAPQPQRLEEPLTILSATVFPDHFASTATFAPSPKKKKMEPIRLHVPGPRRPSAAKQPLQNAFLSSAVQVQAKQLAEPPLKRTDSEAHMEKLLDSVLVDILNDPDEIKVNRSSAVHANQSELLRVLDIPYWLKVMRPDGFLPAAPANIVAPVLSQAKTVALGDLHGSYRKLMETLIAAGFVSMPAKQAQQFAELAVQTINFAQASKGHSAEDVKELSEHVDKLLALIPAMQWTGGANRKLILMGDVVNDRGTADQITLGIVKHLTKDDPDRILRIASNHDHDVLTAMTDWQGIKLNSNCANSRLNAFVIAEAQGGESMEALKQDYYDYLRQSKLMHYEPGSRTLYVHAPVTAKHMRNLIEYLQNNQTRWDLDTVKDYDDIRTSEDVMRFVEQANQFYRGYMEQVQQLGSLDPDAERMLVGSDEANGFLWSRASLSSKTELSFEGPVQRLVHGHDPDSDKSLFSLARQDNNGYRVVNLDQDVRKDAQHIMFFHQEFPRKHKQFQKEASRQFGNTVLTPFYEDMLRFVYSQKKSERECQNLLYTE